MTTPALAIEATGLVKAFGDTLAVDGVDLAVRTGSVYGVLGPNGAGKTTTIRMLATLIRPDAGSARVLGHDIVREADAVRAAVSLTGQLASVDEDLTGRENLILLGRLLGLGRPAAKERATELLEAFGIADAAGRLVKNYSGGMRRRLDIAASIVVTPRADVPRRADHRPGPALAQPGVGHHPRARRRGHDDPALHPVPRGGRPARRRDRRDRPRQGDRRGNARPAEGVRRLRRPARAPARPRAAARGRAGCSSASSAPSRSSPTLPRCRSTCADADRARRGGRRAGPLGRADRRLLPRPAEPGRGLPGPDRPPAPRSQPEQRSRRGGAARHERRPDHPAGALAPTPTGAVRKAIASTARPPTASPRLGRPDLRLARHAQGQARARAAARRDRSRR